MRNSVVLLSMVGIVVVLFILWVWPVAKILCVYWPTSIEEFLNTPCPKGVKAPIYELCQRMVKDVNFFQVHPDSFVRYRSTTGTWVDSYGIRYKVEVLKKDPLTGEHLMSICEIILPEGMPQNIDLSIQEARYFNLALRLRESILDKERAKRKAVEEQERERIKNNSLETQ